MPTALASLPTTADDAQRGRQPEHGRLEHRFQVGVDADLGEEHGDEDVAHGAQVAGDAFVVVAAPQAQACHEGADDEGQLGGIGQFGEREGDGERGNGDGGG